MTESPLSGGTPTWPCAACGEAINTDILAGSPDCPHGWVSLEGMSLAEQKAVFADAEDCDCDEPHLSLDPEVQRRHRSVQIVLNVDLHVWPDETPQAVAREFAERIQREYETVSCVVPMKAVWVR